jgi:hypothetical protein
MLRKRIWTAATVLGTGLITGCSGSEEPPPATALAIDVAPPASVQNRVAFATAPAVSLRDAAGDRVRQAGIVITATAAGTGITLSGASASTDTAGVATFTGLTATGVVGTRLLIFSAGTLTAVSASVDVTAGVPASITGSWSDPISPVSLPLRVFPSVVVRDADGNAVPGATVTFSVTAGGGAIENPSQSTGSSGGAIAGVWTLGPSAGSNALSASVTGVASSVTFGATGAAVTPFVEGGHSSRCIVAATGYNYCWTGTGSPTKLTSGPYFKRIYSGGRHFCGIAYDDTAFCWGDNEFGQVGDGSTTNRLAPVPIASSARFVDISPSDVSTCGITTTGSALCWGRRFIPGPGIPAGPIVAPLAVPGDLSFQSISLAGPHACAIHTGGGIYCWAANDPPTSATSNPTIVPGGLTFTELATGVRKCAISSGTAYCWGSAVGLPPSPTAMVVPGSPVMVGVATSASDSDSCLVAVTGAAYCFGPNGTGEVGDGTTDVRTSPTLVGGGHVFRAVASSDSDTCAMTTTGQVYCWGAGRLSPVLVTLPP